MALPPPRVRATSAFGPNTPLFALYLGILKLVIQAIRVRQFRTRWQPRFAEFMHAQTAPLEQFFRSPRRMTSPASSGARGATSPA